MDQTNALGLSAVAGGELERDIDILESSFFKDHPSGRTLPTPQEVLALAGQKQFHPRPLPVRLDHLNLFVKFGSHVTVTEAPSLCMIRKTLGEEVPLARGETLRDRWDALSLADKTTAVEDLPRMITSLRQVEQKPHDTFIRSINRGHLIDYVLDGGPPGGPFPTIKHFNGWLAQLPWNKSPDLKDFEDPYRPLLSDVGEIKLTHGDLHRGNIIVSSTGPRVLAIVDWAHCGRYPDYWEYCKTAYTS